MSTQLRFAQQIHKRLQARRAELLARQRRANMDLAHRIEPLAADSSEQAGQLANDEALQVIGTSAYQEILAIDEALERQARGLFGVCKKCGGEISSERLNAVPYATMCARCLR